MVWFRVDDILPFHERVLDAGNAAMGVWVRAGAWSSGHLSDGFVPRTIARQIGTPSEVRRLVQVGLWLEVEGGYRFHAWAEDGTGTKRQPTRAEIEAQRKAERDRKAAYRAGRRTDSTPESEQSPAGVPAGVPAGQGRDTQQDSTPESGHPDPTRPDPDQGSPSGDPSISPAAPAKRERRTRIPDGFTANDSHRRYAHEHRLNLDEQLEAFRNHALMTGRLGLDWDAGFRNWLAKAAQYAQQRPQPAGGRESSLDRRDRQREQMFADLAHLDQQQGAIGA